MSIRSTPAPPRRASEPRCLMQGFDPSLSYAMGDDRHLRARCRCKLMVAVPIQQWLDQGLVGHRLSSLADRLRCQCGARSVSLEVWSGPADPQALAYGGIYVFR
ncbi:hypothetical protein P7B02_03240 [Caulobacter segnis]|uniref:hypothetical protein n=1 Tax=Caulobacter segnis TaxID=88688 RepID=UPI00240EB9C3|nr:hypothetical protein [Caulobacter segnis]MDG2520545.1 hypothetical protein [Caulobacter segnis]